MASTTHNAALSCTLADDQSAKLRQRAYSWLLQWLSAMPYLPSAEVGRLLEEDARAQLAAALGDVVLTIPRPGWVAVQRPGSPPIEWPCRCKGAVYAVAIINAKGGQHPIAHWGTSGAVRMAIHERFGQFLDSKGALGREPAAVVRRIVVSKYTACLPAR